LGYTIANPIYKIRFEINDAKGRRMEVSVDISLYPLKEDFVGPILAFIDAIEKADGMTVVRNSLSTQVFGDYHMIMKILEKEVYNVLDVIPDSVFVLKIVGRNRYGITD